MTSRSRLRLQSRSTIPPCCSIASELHARWGIRDAAIDVHRHRARLARHAAGVERLRRDLIRAVHRERRGPEGAEVPGERPGRGPGAADVALADAIVDRPVQRIGGRRRHRVEDGGPVDRGAGSDLGCGLGEVGDTRAEAAARVHDERDLGQAVRALAVRPQQLDRDPAEIVGVDLGGRASHGGGLRGARVRRVGGGEAILRVVERADRGLDGVGHAAALDLPIGHAGDAGVSAQRADDRGGLQGVVVGAARILRDLAGQVARPDSRVVRGRGAARAVEHRERRDDPDRQHQARREDLDEGEAGGPAGPFARPVHEAPIDGRRRRLSALDGRSSAAAA